jgi:hypothetical protein
VFGKAIGRFEQLAKQGRIHGHKEYLAVTGNSGRVAGFMIVEGELEELLRLQAEPEQVKLLTEAQAITDNFNVQIFAGGTDRAVQERITMYSETLQELGVL